MKTIIAVNGACGRMGQRIIQLAHEDQSLQIVTAVDFAGHPEQGHDIGVACGLGKLGVPVTAAVPLDSHLDVLIDFSTPDGTMSVLNTCIGRRIPLVVATTVVVCKFYDDGSAVVPASAFQMIPASGYNATDAFQVLKYRTSLFEPPDSYGPVLVNFTSGYNLPATYQ